MANTSCKTLGSYVTLSALLLIGATAAGAQTITAAPAAVHVGDNFYGLGYGQAGQVLWYTSAAGSYGPYNGYDPVGVGASVQLYPSYVTLTEIQNGGQNHNVGQTTGFGGYGYPSITEANDTPTSTTVDPYSGNPNTSPLQAGLAGSPTVVTTGSGLGLITLTLGAGVPSALQIGILNDFAGAGDTPGSITLTAGGGSAATMLDTPSSGVGNLYLFTISGAQSGQTLTLSETGGAASTDTFYSGLTFDTLAAAPEPSGLGSLSIGALALVGLGWFARRRSGRQAV